VSCTFAARLLEWHAAHGRHDLPWQHPRSPYRVWLSEIMLQQTQVATVIPYFQRFIEALPDLPALAMSSLDEVLALWSGLGYYSRARNLHHSARICMEQYRGQLPEDFGALIALPGIGRSTAGAILAQAHGQRFAILDGNVRRLFARHAGIGGWPGEPKVQKKLWEMAESLLPDSRMPEYVQAQMDLGATVCRPKRPDCPACPLQSSCVAFGENRVEQLPTARPRREQPLRERWMIWARNSAGETLLQRRASVGIWAGLWSLPEFESEQQALEWASGLLGDTRICPDIIEFRHVFTHFRLHARVLRIQTEGPALGIADGGDFSWTGTDRQATTGLPAPIRRLLASHSGTT